MKILLSLLLAVISITNCYLTDLEDFKYLEDHSGDHLELIPQPSFYQDYDTIIHDFFNVNTYFTIDRRIQYSFFIGRDTTIEAPQIKLIGENGINYTQGEYSFQSWYSYDPKMCSRYFTIRVLAISDIDTIKTTATFQNRHYFHCEKGGVDSIPVNLQFGNDSALISYAKLMKFISFPDISTYQNPIIITRFSRTYNKSFIMLLNDDHRVDSIYNFYRPDNLDSLLHQTIYTTCLFYECNISGTIDRETLCKIYEKKVSINNSSTIHEISSGKQYALLCPIHENNDYLVFLLRINNIIYDNTLSGTAKCMLYMLN